MTKNQFPQNSGDYDQNEHSSTSNQQRKRQNYPVLAGALLLLIALLPVIGAKIFSGGLLQSQDNALLKRINARLSFHLVKDQAMAEDQLKPINSETELILAQPANKGTSAFYFKVDKEPSVHGTSITRAELAKDEIGGEIIRISFDSAGAAQFADITEKNIGIQLAIVYNNRIITTPVIQSRITGGEAQISGRNLHFILDELQDAEQQ